MAISCAASYNRKQGELELGLYKIFVYFKAFVHERIIPILPFLTCIAHTIAILLHDYCAI